MGVPVCVCVCVYLCMCVCVCVRVRVCVDGLTLNLEIALNNWINSLNTTSTLDIKVAPATRTKAASVAKRMSTATFVRNDIRSKYMVFLSKTSMPILLYTIDTTKNPVRYLFLVHTCAGFLYSLYM